MRVNDKFPQWLTSGGITSEAFTGLVSNLVYPYFYAPDKPVFRYPYESSVFPSVTIGTQAQWLSSLDVMFATRFGQRQLRKWVSDLDVHTDSTKAVTSDNIRYTNIIAQMINERYGDKWNRIAEALAIEYEPLENYNRTENSSFNKDSDADNYDSSTFGSRLDGTGSASDPIIETVDDRFDKKSIKGGYSDADSRSVTKSGQYEIETIDRDSVHGFNGTVAFDSPGSPSEYSKRTEKFDYDKYGEGHEATELNGGAITRDYHGIKDDNENPYYNEEYAKDGSEFTKHHIDGKESGWNHSSITGNIGVTTSQQMLEQELEVRKNVLFDIILNDIADMLTISIY